MGPRRRNSITGRDASLVLFVAAVSALVAGLAGCAPTGETVPDVALTTGFAAFVTWAGASAPWWAITVTAGLVAMSSVAQPALATFALVAGALGTALGVSRHSLPAVRALASGIVVQVSLRLGWNPGFLVAGLVATVTCGVLVVSGLSRRQRLVRRRAVMAAAIAGGFVLLALVGLAGGGIAARSTASDGYDDLLRGLSAVRDGEPAAAAASLRQAAGRLRDARATWSAPWSQPARLVPALAQNRRALDDVLGRAADAADAAAVTLGLIDPEQLRVVRGVIDVEALALLGGPLGDLEQIAAELSQALDEVDSPWLMTPFRDRLHTAQRLAADVAREAATTGAVARTGPAMLGAEGPRRYLVGFTSPAELRGQSGLMGNWAEITVDRGALELTDQGRTAELISGLDRTGGGRLDLGDEFVARYGRYGAQRSDGTVDPKFWSNVTMSPHMPTVGSAMAQLYEQATGRPVDGVIVVDPAGLAALLELTGPVSVPSAGVRLDSTNVEQYLLVDQYRRPEAQREDVLESVTDATVRRVLSATLPAPQVLAGELGAAATEGHISLWAERPDEQELMARMASDAALPTLAGRDGLAVVNDNASGNKIDTFLERWVTYRARVDERTGAVRATLTVVLTNTAPTEGFPDYVLGNLIDLPTGTNRTLLSVYTPLAFSSASLDGAPLGLTTGVEQGWQVHSTFVTVGAGETRTVELQLEGRIAAGDYTLVYRPQPLARGERLFVEVKNHDGTTVAGFAGTLTRRSVLGSDGLSAWRPSPTPSV